MARKKVYEVSSGNVTAKVYRDSEWNEFRVRFYFDGILNEDADYFTTDKEDAIESANFAVKSGGK